MIERQLAAKLVPRLISHVVEGDVGERRSLNIFEESVAPQLA